MNHVCATMPSDGANNERKEGGREELWWTVYACETEPLQKTAIAPHRAVWSGEERKAAT